MWRSVGAFVISALVAAATMPAGAGDKHEIKGGIDGKVKKVDVDKKTLTITTTQGKERTFKVTDETIMLGPRGGKVRQHLKDPRFHEGFHVIIVADGTTASEIHFGFARDDGDTKTESGKTVKSDPQIAKNAPKSKAIKQLEEDDEEEIPGKVKSFDSTKRILVVSLLNGKDRSFLLAKDVPIHVKGVISKQGLQDPALQIGATVTIVTDEGGRKVKDVKIVAAKLRKAG
jgi:predicted RNA-binding protein